MVNKGKPCMIIHTQILCTLARKGDGSPSYRSRPCWKCKEWRCITHCKCGREGTARGRHAARLSPVQAAVPKANAVAKAKAAPKAQPKAAPHPQAKAAPQPVLQPAVAAPQPVLQPAVVQPAVPETKVHADDAWFNSFLSQLPTTEEVHASAMMIDDPAFCTGLAAELRKKRGFKVTLVVDRQHYNNATSRFQAPRLQELKKLGASVFLGTGHRGTHMYGDNAYTGLMHRKAIVLDWITCFVGGANITKSSRKSREIMMEVSGSAVLEVLALILEAKHTGTQL